MIKVNQTMKKLFITLISLCTFSSILTAQTNNTFHLEDIVVNAGISARWISSNNQTTFFPSLTASADYCLSSSILENRASIGIGGLLSMGFISSNYGDSYTHFTFGPRGTFHYHFVENLDTYASVLLGYGVGNNSGGFIYDFGLGARYYLTPSLAIMSEIGVLAPLSFGAAFRF